MVTIKNVKKIAVESKILISTLTKIQSETLQELGERGKGWETSPKLIGTKYPSSRYYVEIDFTNMTEPITCKITHYTQLESRPKGLLNRIVCK